MKKWVLIVGFIAAAVSVQAGSYVNDFDSAGHLSTDLGDGSVISGDQAFVYNPAGNSGVMVLTQDFTGGKVGNFILPTLDVGYAIDGFTATFNSYLKASATPADGFSFNIGAMPGTLPYGGEDGMYSSGTMLSVGFDTYGADIGIDVFINGILLSQNLLVTPNVSAAGIWTEITIVLDENGLDVIYGGTSAFTDLDVSGYVAQDGDRFGFAARTGASFEDAFIDDVDIQTVPEPASALMICLGASLVLVKRRYFSKI